MFKKIPIVFLLILFPFKAQTSSFNNLTIVVSSCDRYSNLWDGFFKQLFLHWPTLKNEDQNIPIVLINNKKQYENSRVTLTNTQDDKSWSDNMLKALDLVKTDYVLILLDDYFLTHFDRNRLLEIYEYMTTHDVSYIYLYGAPAMTASEPILNPKGLVHIAKHSTWRTSLQVCLWKTQDLKHLLKPGESAWDFEITGSFRSEGMKGDFLATTENLPLSYLNVAQVGYISDFALEKAKKMGIDLSQALPLERNHRIRLFFTRTAPMFLYWQIYVPITHMVKATFKALCKIGKPS